MTRPQGTEKHYLDFKAKQIGLFGKSFVMYA